MSSSRPKRRDDQASIQDQSGPSRERREYQKVYSGPPDQFFDHTTSLYQRQVLIVEDEIAIGFALELELAEVGAIPVGPAASLIAALEVIDTEAIDGAILDIDLSGVDVFPLADLLIEQGICFVFHTAHCRRQELRDVYPGIPICSKPVDPNLVLQTLGEAFSHRGRN